MRSGLQKNGGYIGTSRLSENRTVGMALPESRTIEV